MKITSRGQLQKTKGLYGVYKWLKKKRPDILDKILPYKRIYWNEKLVIKVLKDNGCNNVSGWLKISSSSYQYAIKSGIYDSVCKKMNFKRAHVDYSKPELMEIAKKYQTVTEFVKGANRHYVAARRRGFLDDICKHMLPKYESRRKKVININTGYIYTSAKEAIKFCKIKSASSIKLVCQGKQKNAGGYRWTYCDEKGNVIK